MATEYASLTIDTKFGVKHRLALVNYPTNQKVNLDTTAESGKLICSDLTFDQAHEIADFIKTNVPAPAPVDPYAEARAVFDALEIGDTFHFGSGNSGKDRRHQKVSATGFRYDWGYGAALEDFPTEVEDYLHHGVIPNPKPTIREQVNELPDGTPFTATGPERGYGPVGRYIKLETDSVWARSARKVWDLSNERVNYSAAWNAPGTVTVTED